MYIVSWRRLLEGDDIVTVGKVLNSGGFAGLIRSN
jgi:hypothetical protein